MQRATTLETVADLAEDQWGLFTRRQAEAAGLAWTTISRLARTGGAERIAHGVYRLRGGPPAEQLDLRAAWLQLAPELAAWDRGPETGLVSHRSAAALYGIGHLPADVHEFTLPKRRQSRRPDVRLHRGQTDEGWIRLRGLLVTLPSRIAADLLAERDDPQAVGQLIADALRSTYDYPARVAEAIAPYAAHFGLRRGDGLALLGWLLELSGDPGQSAWLAEAGSGWQRAESAR
ncbi:MAG: type IV toxin-antitoxin system AbiEi family antitoxin domain-containing protein [Actinomycetota bacterium]|nr:type IV toxin-antitoxin system AbiEi family antitoxin domain-containing protein [Actinomycetota bacterium]